jgi:hypothetical protein
MRPKPNFSDFLNLVFVLRYETTKAYVFCRLESIPRLEPEDQDGCSRSDLIFSLICVVLMSTANSLGGVLRKGLALV